MGCGDNPDLASECGGSDGEVTCTRDQIQLETRKDERSIPVTIANRDTSPTPDANRLLRITAGRAIHCHGTDDDKACVLSHQTLLKLIGIKQNFLFKVSE